MPLARNEIKLTTAQEANFWAKVDKNGPTMPHMNTPCWIWTAGKTANGYGSFRIGRMSMGSHRVAWAIANGPIPHDGSYHGGCILHRCDNQSCCRFDHLFTGTHLDNIKDMNAKGRQSKGVFHYSHLCPGRVAHGEVHVCAKLTATQVIEIRQRYVKGTILQRQLAAEFGVSDSCIRSIFRRKSWKHIP